MKTITLIFISWLSLTSYAELIEGKVDFQDFSSAEKSPQLTWIVESTKVGLFSSDVFGYVLNYKYSGDLDKENFILRNMTLSFPITSMNSDNESRDEKLHSKCLGANEFKDIIVKINGPIFLMDKRERKYLGSVLIRGKEKPFQISITPQLETNSFNLKGFSTWSLREMEIPDPSIAVAKLSDDIKLKINLSHSFR